MIVLKKAGDISSLLTIKKKAGNLLGFVPTMGALHQGHISLINESKGKNNLVICSIFVNPAQFNDSKDFDKYPSTLETDIDMLEKAGCDIVFLPSVIEMYPVGLSDHSPYNLGYLENILEGKFRPGHFQGVCKAVERLLDIVQPHYLYLGQKDYQQCMVIKKLCTLINSTTEVIICPTVRENEGLAMSSRNLRLSVPEKKLAQKIFETLRFIKQDIKPGYLEELKSSTSKYLSTEGIKPDYVEIADSITLKPVVNWDGKTPLVALIAAYINDVRLIDNMLLSVP